MYLVLNYTCSSSHFHSVMYACFRILFHTPFVCAHFICRFNPVKGSEIKHNIAFLIRLAKDDQAPSCSKLSEFPTRSEFSACLEGGFGQVDLGRGGASAGVTWVCLEAVSFLFLSKPLTSALTVFQDHHHSSVHDGPQEIPPG